MHRWLSRSQTLQTLPRFFEWSASTLLRVCRLSDPWDPLRYVPLPAL